MFIVHIIVSFKNMFFILIQTLNKVEKKLLADCRSARRMRQYTNLNVRLRKSSKKLSLKIQSIGVRPKRKISIFFLFNLKYK